MLSEFRTRVAEHGLGEAALDGLLKARGKQCTDSTHVIVAVCGLHTIELVRKSVQEALAAACPDWLAARRCAGDWARRYGTRVDSWHPPENRVRNVGARCGRHGDQQRCPCANRERRRFSLAQT